MNLQERKKDFDIKVTDYVNASITRDLSAELKVENYYELYLRNTYKDEFKDFSFSSERDYVQVNFNYITKTENVKN